MLRLGCTLLVQILITAFAVIFINLGKRQEGEVRFVLAICPLSLIISANIKTFGMRD